jgi:hypothetical protein
MRRSVVWPWRHVANVDLKSRSVDLRKEKKKEKDWFIYLVHIRVTKKLQKLSKHRPK